MHQTIASILLYINIVNFIFSNTVVPKIEHNNTLCNGKININHFRLKFISGMENNVVPCDHIKEMSHDELLGSLLNREQDKAIS